LAASNNTFFKNFTNDQTFCWPSTPGLTPGSLKPHAIAFKGQNEQTMPPGKYSVLSNYADIAGSDNDRCSTWADENLSVTVEWKRDSITLEDVSWNSRGLKLSNSNEYIPTSVIGDVEETKVAVTRVLQNTWWESTDILKPFYVLDVTFPAIIHADAIHWFYFSKTLDGSCDCSRAACTDRTRVDPAYVEWPNVGPSNCQFSHKTYTINFPEEGKYELCVTKEENTRGWAVKTSLDQVQTAVTLSINPTPPGPTSSPVPASLGSPSSTVATLFAMAAAVIGALIL